MKVLIGYMIFHGFIDHLRCKADDRIAYRLSDCIRDFVRLSLHLALSISDSSIELSVLFLGIWYIVRLLALGTVVPIELYYAIAYF